MADPAIMGVGGGAPPMGANHGGLGGHTSYNSCSVPTDYNSYDLHFTRAVYYRLLYNI